MKITRTITKARYAILKYNKDTKSMVEDDYIDTENIKPEYIEKSIARNMPDNMRLCEVEQVERLSFKLTMNLSWDADEPLPRVKVESLEPVENGAYNE